MLSVVVWCGLLAASGWTASPEIELRPAAVKPGDALLITVTPAETPIGAVVASFLGERPLFTAYQGRYVALMPVGGRTPPRTYPLYFKIILTDGQVYRTTLYLKVGQRRFPTTRVRGMPKSKRKYMDPELLRREREKLLAALAESAPEPLWEGKFLVPVQGRVTSEFGHVRYVAGRFWGQHSGVDIAAPAGTPVRAANNGRIVLAEMLAMRGGTIIIDHGLHLFTELNHLSAIEVKVGEVVKKGDFIGKVGSTGFATGPHLHWGMRIATRGTDGSIHSTPVRPWNFAEQEWDLGPGHLQ